MTFDEFIERNRDVLIGHYLISEVLGYCGLETPYPPQAMSDAVCELFWDEIRASIPLDTMITDLWNWDVHFESHLDDDWFYQAIFGPPEVIAACARDVADFFIEQCYELDLDYGTSPDDPDFEEMILEESEKLIRGWRQNLRRRVAESGASFLTSAQSEQIEGGN